MSISYVSTARVASSALVLFVCLSLSACIYRSTDTSSDEGGDREAPRSSMRDAGSGGPSNGGASNLGDEGSDAIPSDPMPDAAIDDVSPRREVGSSDAMAETSPSPGGDASSRDASSRDEGDTWSLFPPSPSEDASSAESDTSGGGPGCSSGMKRCGGACVDLRTNDDHCGRCNNRCPNDQTCKSRSCRARSQITTIVKYTNQARSTPTDCGQYGKRKALPPVTGNSELHEAAQAHADSMAKHGFFSHQDPTDGSDFVTRVGRANYSGSPLGENIASGSPRNTPRQIVQGWVRSDGHCRNIADPQATEIGIGYAESNSGPYGAYWVQVFGR